MNHALFASMPFDGVKDFSPIAMLAYVTNTMVVHPSVPAKTVPRIHRLRQGQSGRDRLCLGGARLDQSSVRGAVRKDDRGADGARPVSRRCSGVERHVSGQCQLLFTAGTQSLEYVKSGALRLLAVTEGKRSTLLPDVPTVGETIPGYEMSVWYGAFGPAGMPNAIVDKLNAEISRILFLADVKNRMAAIAVEVARMTPEELGALTRSDAEKWGKIIRELEVTAQ